MNRLPILKNFYNKSATPIQLNMLKVLDNKNSNFENIIINQSNFLKRELQVRLSHRVFNLIKLPYGLPHVDEIKSITNLYIDSFDQILNFESINSVDTVKKFSKLLENIKYNHNDLEIDMSKGIKKIENYDLVDLNILNKELDNFFLSRIGIRTLINHFTSTVNEGPGIIKECNISTLINNCKDDVNYITSRIYKDDVADYIHLDGDDNLSISYIPEHIHYIIMEILKNAVIASYSEINETFTPINITFSEGKDYIIIKISDQGDSFSKSKLKNILSYSYSTYPIDISKDYLGNYPIIGGLGFGLPMSRIYSKYFNGDLIICPMEKIGTDVFIYINKLGNNEEVLYI